jgi:hypothetical protein
MSRSSNNLKENRRAQVLAFLPTASAWCENSSNVFMAGLSLVLYAKLAPSESANSNKTWHRICGGNHKVD